MADEYSDVVVAQSNHSTEFERLGRSMVVAMAVSSSVCLYPMQRREAKRSIVAQHAIARSRAHGAGGARRERGSEGTGASLGRRVMPQFQNENLVARDGERVLMIVPDVIAVLDAATAGRSQSKA